ncbi:MAG: 5-bromo-4-chloroindolyl phosphate hydrolysis family protein [Candidatus Choladocola sp.]|nr:5-bromo-4-chloroindolyl phosphate hydrolysis family protein [Candidatus Choladocola sp.]
MMKKDWYEAGDQIKQIVQDAIDSKDFSELSSSIANVVDSTVNELQSALKDVVDNNRQKYQYTNKEAADRIKRNMQEKHQAEEKQRKNEPKRETKPVAVRTKVPGETSGRIMAWLGYCLGSTFGLALLFLLFVGLAVRNLPFIAFPAAFLAIVSGGAFVTGICGTKKLGFAKRFRRYQEILGERTYCLIEELASAAGKSCRFVRRDLKKMIHGGYFKEGYLDRKETLLITDQQTYQQYLTTQTEYERREMAKDRKKEQKETDSRKETVEASENGAASVSLECAELIREGRNYIRHIHACNERIPEEEMSSKLDRLELVITRIFREAEKDPSVAGELKKMMSYYLPTTRKLLDAYCELNDQPIRGQNIESTKKEIEDALDTINTAFENLLDSLFQETAWDISSDISVLHTMLAQEGLTEKDFAQK